MSTQVRATSQQSTSIHLFETYKEACNFAAWLMEYNADLELVVENIDDENIITESPTFI